ncbi:MAG: ATP-grasp domain-containing protein [Thermoplasmata archaeon]|nr:ATP-grasp domain-containing protein [Thermoplasmata archaeon]
MPEELSHIELEEQSSLLFWYPKIVGKIPTPETTVLKITQKGYGDLQGMPYGKPLSAKLIKNIELAIKDMETPFFLRTDQASGKHDWLDTCFVQDKSKILQHLCHLIEWHACAGIMGLYFTALVFREYVPLHSQFTAFNGMPVAPEWRWFVRDGQPVCKHFYWPDNAIRNPSSEDWLPILHNMQSCKPEDDKLLNKYATIFAENNPGFWSVDFALTRDRGWILIDAARGEESWHPEDCLQNPKHEELMKERDKPKPDFEIMLVRREVI